MGVQTEIKKLDSLLEKHFHKKIKILRQDIKRLTAPGENYGSIMLAVNLTIEEDNKEKQLNLVAKLIPDNEVLREVFEIQVSFVKELKMYREIVPTLRELEDEYGILENRASDLFAKCYGGRKNLKEEKEGLVDDDSVLLFENLKTLGFETGNRLIGFDFETSAFVLTHLAKFHATPIALKHLKPNVYKEVIFNILFASHEPTGADGQSCSHFMNGIKEIIFKKPEHEDKINLILNNLFTRFTDYFYETSDAEGTFVTINHSDFWVNNVMLKFDEKQKPEKMILVDFQAPQNHTLVADLLFFIFTSVMPSVMYDRADELIKIYYDSFISRLKEFNLDLEQFSWDAFIEEIKKNGVNALGQLFIMYKPIFLERGSFEDMNDVTHDNFLTLEGMSEDCKIRILKTFNHFVDKGWI